MMSAASLLFFRGHKTREKGGLRSDGSYSVRETAGIRVRPSAHRSPLPAPFVQRLLNILSGIPHSVDECRSPYVRGRLLCDP